MLIFATRGLRSSDTAAAWLAVLVSVLLAPQLAAARGPVLGYTHGSVPWMSNRSWNNGLVEIVCAPQEESRPGSRGFDPLLSSIPAAAPPARRSTDRPPAEQQASQAYASSTSRQGLEPGTRELGAPGPSAAYACFELPQSSTLGISWESLPGDFNHYFVGIRSSDEAAWHWFDGPNDGILTLPSSIVSPDNDGRMLACVAITGGDPGVLALVRAGVMEVRGTGLTPDTVARNYGDGLLAVLDLAVNERGLPTSVDLRRYAPAIRDQGHLSACAAFAGCGCMDIMLSRTYGSAGWNATQPRFLTSPMWLYVQSGLLQEGKVPSTGFCLENNGRNPLAIGDVLCKLGTCTEDLLPYADSSCTQSLSAEASQRAAKLRAASGQFVDPPTAQRAGGSALSWVKSRLADFSEPVELGWFDLDREFLSYSGGVYHLGTPMKGAGHAMCFVGYDDQHQALLIRNSWGPDWGDKGYSWLAYSSFIQLCQQGRMCLLSVHLEYNPDVSAMLPN